ncbi:MAG: hypothetical protein KAS04_04475, partial [Candidatus Aenigmarchaeota archaeon]|nr:hypothetical protein [Candidatus Aenigmarchaeota archaeon]
IMIAQQTRGYSKRNLKKLTVHFPVIVPLLSKSLGMARTLAISVESRGFGRAKTKYNIKMKYYDWIVICVTFLFNVYLYLFYSA